MPQKAGQVAEVTIRGLVKRFETDGDPVEVLSGVDLDLTLGDAVVITGPSGAGKSTLLHLIGGLDQPSAGSIVIGGQAIHELPETDLARFRNRTVGLKLGQGLKLAEITASMKMVAEGIRTVTSAYQLKNKFDIQASIIEETYQVVQQGKSPHKALQALMDVETTSEFTGIKGME